MKTRTASKASVSETSPHKPSERKTHADATDSKPETANTNKVTAEKKSLSTVETPVKATDSKPASEKVEIPLTSTATDTEEAAATRRASTRSRAAESKVTAAGEPPEQQ